MVSIILYVIYNWCIQSQKGKINQAFHIFLCCLFKEDCNWWKIYLQETYLEKVSNEDKTFFWYQNRVKDNVKTSKLHCEPWSGKKKKKKGAWHRSVSSSLVTFGGFKLFHTSVIIDDLQISSSQKLEAEITRDHQWEWEDSEMVLSGEVLLSLLVLGDPSLPLLHLKI